MHLMLSYRLILFAFNLIFVFAFIRYGHIIFWEAFRICESTTAERSWLTVLFQSAVFKFVGFPLGIWNPANDLIVGEGCAIANATCEQHTFLVYYLVHRVLCVVSGLG